MIGVLDVGVVFGGELFGEVVGVIVVGEVGNGIGMDVGCCVGVVVVSEVVVGEGGEIDGK